MQRGGGEFRPHALAEQELAHGLVEQRPEPQHGHELVAPAALAVGFDAVDAGQQVEAIDQRQVPPELAALPNTTPMRATWRTRSS